MGAGKSKKKEVILVGLDGSGKTTTLRYVVEGADKNREVTCLDPLFRPFR